MLSANKPLMINVLNSLITPSEGYPLYDAAYNAYYESNKCNFDTVSIDEDPNGIANNAASDINKLITDRSKIFAKTFCEHLQNNGFMDSIAEEIDNHIKSMLITINVPALLPTIVSPMGPCTGSLTISEATGAQITIN